MAHNARKSFSLTQASLTLLVRVLFLRVLGWKGVLLPPAMPIKIEIEGGGFLEAGIVESTTGQPGGVVILCHPFVKYGMHYFQRNGIDAMFARAGYHVILFNFGGFGRSFLSGPDFTQDVRRVVQWASGQYPGLSLHLMGLSFGGYHAIHALAGMDGVIRSAIFDSVPPFLGNFFRQGLTGVIMRRIGKSRWKGKTGTADIRESLAHIHKTAVTLFVGGKDETCSPQERESLQALRNVTVKVFPEARHLEAMKMDREEYSRHATDFLVTSV